MGVRSGKVALEQLGARSWAAQPLATIPLARYNAMRLSANCCHKPPAPNQASKCTVVGAHRPTSRLLLMHAGSAGLMAVPRIHL